MTRGESDGDEPPPEFRRLEPASFFRLSSRDEEVRADAKLHRLTFLFIAAAIAASSSLVVYTGWTHDLENGLFALAFAVASSRVAMNWLVWKNEEI